MIKFLGAFTLISLFSLAIFAKEATQQISSATSLEESAAEKSFIIKSYKKIELASPHDVFDMGVADINGDGILDIYSTGHYTRDNLLLGDGKGNYTDALTRLGLDQSREFPYLEDMDADPVLQEPGLYIHRRRRLLIFRAHELDKLGTISGRILVPSPTGNKRPPPIEVQWAEHASADITNLTSASGETWTKIQFSIAPGGTLALDTLYVALPFEVTLDSSVPLSYVKVGNHTLNPKEHSFVLRWRDRHGVAWAELNGDHWLDALMSTGGLRAAMNLFKQPNIASIASDELLLSDGDGHYRDVTAELGIHKGDCRTYKPAWVDVNQDNRLDLYFSCMGGANQLYLQDSKGHFTEVAGKYELDLNPGTQFIWFDADNDGDMDLLADLNGDHKDPNFALFTDVNSHVALFINQGGKFEHHLIDRPFKGSVMQFALGDFDGDGDQDVYVITAGQQYRHHSFLLMNNKGMLEPREMASWGLPANCLAANWVDVDLDGKLDFYCVPVGIFYQAQNGYFKGSNDLTDWKAAQRARNGVSSWYDADNDGAWDVLITLAIGPSKQYGQAFRQWGENQAKKQGQTFQEWWLGRKNATSSLPPNMRWPLPPSWRWYRTRLYQGQQPANHWLQLELAGPEGNRNAIGARVALTTGDSTQVRAVGSSEGAHFSQGHYRLYFGLGKSAKANEITVYWPDGKVKTLSQVSADQLLNIPYP